MAIARVQFGHAEAGGSGTSIGATLNGIIAASLVVVTSSNDSGTAVTSVTDDLTVAAVNTVSLIDSIGFSQRYDHYYFKDYGGGNRTITVNYAAATPYRSIVVVELSGADTIAPAGPAAGQRSSGPVTTADSSAVTPTKNGAYFAGYCECVGPNTSPIPAGGAFVVFDEPTNDHNTSGYVQATAASKSATWTIPSGAYAAIVSTFYPDTTGVQRIQSNSNARVATGTTIVSPSTTGIAAASLVAVHVRYDNTGGITTLSVKDDLGVSAVIAVGITEGTDSIRTEIWYFKNYGGGTRTFTATFSATTTTTAIEVEELAGADTIAPLGATSSSDTVAATTASAGSVTPTRNNSYISALAANANFVMTPSSPMLDVVNDSVGIADSSALAQKIAAAVNPTWTTASVANWGAVAAVFLPPVTVVTATYSQASTFPKSRLLFPGRPFGINNPLVEMRSPSPDVSPNATYFQAVGGGVTPGGAMSLRAQKNLGGGATPSGLISRLISKLMLGGATPAGTLTKQSGKPVQGGATPAGMVVNRVNKALGGSSTPTGLLTQFKLTLRLLLGGATPTGTLARQTNKTLAGGVTPIGLLNRLMARLLGGGATPAGTLLKVKNVILGGGVIPAGTVTHRPNKTLWGGVTPTGIISRWIWKTLGGGVTPTGTLAQVRVFLWSLGGGVTPTGTMTKTPIKAVGGGVTPAGTLTRLAAHLLSLAGGVTPTGTLSKRSTKTVTGSVTPTGTLTQIRVYLRNLAGGVTPAGTLLTRVSKVLGGVVTPSGTLARRIFKTIVGGSTPTGVLTAAKTTFRSLVGGITPTGALLRRLNKALGGGVTPGGTLSRQSFRTTSGVVTPTGTLSLTKRVSIFLFGGVTPTGTLTTFFGSAWAYFAAVVQGAAKFGATLFYAGPKTTLKSDPTGGPKLGADNTSQTKLNEKRRL